MYVHMITYIYSTNYDHLNFTFYILITIQANTIAINNISKDNTLNYYNDTNSISSFLYQFDSDKYWKFAPLTNLVSL